MQENYLQIRYQAFNPFRTETIDKKQGKYISKLIFKILD